MEAGLPVDVRIEAPDADVVKTYVAAGFGIALVPAFAFSAQRDRPLRMRDASHLFEASVPVVLLKRETHLADFVYGFLRALDPDLERRRVDALLLGA